MKKPKTEHVIRTTEQFQRWVALHSKWDWESDPRTLTNARHVRRKTNPQIHTIHMLIRRICDHSGDDFEYLKEQFKSEYGPQIEGHGPFAGKSVPKSMSDYDIEEASALIDKIMYVAADFYGIYLEIEDK